MEPASNQPLQAAVREQGAQLEFQEHQLRALMQHMQTMSLQMADLTRSLQDSQPQHAPQPTVNATSAPAPMPASAPPMPVCEPRLPPPERIQKIPRLLVAVADGYLYIYNLDPLEGGECTLMKQHKLDGSVEPPNEILEPTIHHRPLVAQNYCAGMAKGYCEDQGAAGGPCVEDDLNSLHLDEENEQPPMILRTD